MYRLLPPCIDGLLPPCIGGLLTICADGLLPPCIDYYPHVLTVCYPHVLAGLLTIRAGRRIDGLLPPCVDSLLPPWIGGLLTICLTVYYLPPCIVYYPHVLAGLLTIRAGRRIGGLLTSMY